jgi:hypothetical protein
VWSLLRIAVPCCAVLSKQSNQLIITNWSSLGSVRLLCTKRLPWIEFQKRAPDSQPFALYWHCAAQLIAAPHRVCTVARCPPVTTPAPARGMFGLLWWFERRTLLHVIFFWRAFFPPLISALVVSGFIFKGRGTGTGRIFMGSVFLINTKLSWLATFWLWPRGEEIHKQGKYHCAARSVSYLSAELGLKDSCAHEGRMFSLAVRPSCTLWVRL